MTSRKKKQNTSPTSIKSAIRSRIKQLRSDARKLDNIAKHLRIEANELAEGIRVEERAEQARANFYSKKASVDSSTPLVPIFPDEEKS